jgi:hypothetical protein
VFASYTLAFVLQLKEKHGKTSARVATRTTQADIVQYKNNEQYNIQKKNSKTVTVKHNMNYFMCCMSLCRFQANSQF